MDKFPQKQLLKMSSTDSVVVPAETKVKAPRKPTLAAKFNRMLVFGYTLTESLRAKGIVSDDAVEQIFSEIRLMSSLDDQISYYENILSQMSANAKVMKKFVAAKNKPVKEPKVRKPRAKKTVTVQSDASDDVIQNLVDAARDASDAPAVKEKKPRKNAKKDAEEPVPAQVETLPTAETKDKKPRKSKKDAAVPVEAPVEVESLPTAETKDKKPRKSKKDAALPVETPAEPLPVASLPAETNKKSRKSKKAPEPAPQPEPEHAPQPAHDDHDDDDEEILTKETYIDGQLFLIDQHNNLYHHLTHAFIRQL